MDVHINLRHVILLLHISKIMDNHPLLKRSNQSNNFLSIPEIRKLHSNLLYQTLLMVVEPFITIMQI